MMNLLQLHAPRDHWILAPHPNWLQLQKAEEGDEAYLDCHKKLGGEVEPAAGVRDWMSLKRS